MKALYITRKYPPSVGGMQKMNHYLIDALSKKIEVDKVCWGYSQVFLPVFILKAFLYLTFCSLIQGKRYNFICVGDGLLAPLGLFFKQMTGNAVICIAHGLDITFNFPFYQKFITWALKRMDMLVCVSKNTKDECVNRGIKDDRIRVIPNGVAAAVDGLDKTGLLERLKTRGMSVPQDAKILLTVGRLIERKGVAQFIENVFTGLIKEDSNIRYLIIGSGKEKKRIEDTIDRNKLKGSVFLLGEADEELLRYAYAGSDICILPNIKVKDDVEGFGIVALEASSYATPVIASEIEGIKDAVENGRNGLLVPFDKPEAFKESILFLLRDSRSRLELGRKAKEYAKRFSWAKITDMYIEAIKEMIFVRQKRVLMVSRAVEPPWDEASRNMVRDITGALGEYQFHILTTSRAKEEKSNVVCEKIYRNRDNTFSQKLRLLWYLLRNRNNFDIYHFCFTPEPLTSFLIDAIIDKDKKIWSIPYISRRMSKKRIRRLASSTKIMTVTSEFSREIFAKEGINSVKVIYPGVDLEKFNSLKDTENIKETFLPKDSYDVLYAGDLTTNAAVEAVGSIIKQACLKAKGINFVVASRIKKRGDIKRKDTLKYDLARSGLRQRVRFIDSIKDMSLVISGCDLIIYPYFEGFDRKIDLPHVIIEAMACGKPVIISNRKPLKEALKDGAGMAVEGDDPDKFSAAITTLFNDRKLGNKLGIENRKVAQRYFDINKNIRRFRAIYDNILYG